MEFRLILFAASCLLLELAVDQFKQWLRRYRIVSRRQKSLQRSLPTPASADSCGDNHLWGEWFGPYKSEYLWYYGRKCQRCPYVKSRYVEQCVADGALYHSKSKAGTSA